MRKGSQATVLALLQDSDIKARLHQAEAQVEALGRGTDAAKAQELGAARGRSTAQANRDKALTDYRRYEDCAATRPLRASRWSTRAQKDSAEADPGWRSLQEARAGKARSSACRLSRSRLRPPSRARTIAGYRDSRALLGKVVRKLGECGRHGFSHTAAVHARNVFPTGAACLCRIPHPADCSQPEWKSGKPSIACFREW